MNMNQFTQKSLEAVQNAQTIAQEYGNQQIEQVHLLYALLEQENGLIPQLLGGMGPVSYTHLDVYKRQVLDMVPDAEQMTTLVGKSLYEIWTQLCALIDEKYDMERLWGSGGKAWTYEYKYRRGGKTLCALYARENCIGFMIILGKDERLKFVNDREHYSEKVQRIYDETQTYHDGKWLMFEPADTSLFDDFIRLLGIKRKPNRK